jgi:uncharacterized protein (DUF924 family)
MKDHQSDILQFWFEDTAPAAWFQVNADFDALLRDRFLSVYDMAKTGMFDGWASNADGALALIVLFDQFPRNMFRGTPDAFGTDEKALEIARSAIAAGFDQVHPPLRRRFLYLPFEHSENLDDQDLAVQYFGNMQYDDPLGYEYALRHRHVISRFGRFPHRNAILSRASTPEETEFLKTAGSSF